MGSGTWLIKSHLIDIFIKCKDTMITNSTGSYTAFTQSFTLATRKHVEMHHDRANVTIKNAGICHFFLFIVCVCFPLTPFFLFSLHFLLYLVYFAFRKAVRVFEWPEDTHLLPIFSNLFILFLCL